MDFIQFAKEKPILYGQMTMNNKCKIGQFKAEWQHLSNSLIYNYYTHSGGKGQGGFTLRKAHALLINGRLSINPEHGNPDNYV